MRKAPVVLPVLIFAFCLGFIGCGGAAAAGSDPKPDPRPDVTVAVSCLPAQLQVGQVSECRATVTVNGNPGSVNMSVEWSISPMIGTIVRSETAPEAIYTAPASVSATTVITVTATSRANPTRFGTATITIVAPSQTPTISATPASATMAYGDALNGQYTAAGNPFPSVTCQVASGPGSVSCGAGTWTYNLPKQTTKPTVFAATVTLTATNSAGTATARVDITLNYDTPVISITSTQAAHCDRECPPFNQAAVVTLAGTGIYVGGNITVQAGSGPPSITPITSVAANSTQLTFVFDTPRYSPGSFSIVVSSPTDGHGGGASPAVWFDFLGNQDTERFSATQILGNDQAAGVIHVFDLSGQKTNDIATGGLIYSIAIDDKTGYVVYTQPNGVIFKKTDGTVVGGNGNGKVPMAVDAKDGFDCVSQDLDGQAVSMDLSQSTPPLIPFAVSGKPFNTAMLKIGGQLACVIQTVENPGVSWFAIPSGNLLGFVDFPGITPVSQIQPQTKGGSELQVFSSGPKAGVAAALYRADRTVVFADTATRQDRRVSLTGDPFHIAVNNVDGSLVVALVDPATGGTKFAKIDSAGNVTALNSATTLLATGLMLSADGATIIVQNRGASPQRLPNN